MQDLIQKQALGTKTMKKSITEKERRWLLKSKPQLKYDDSLYITQVYLDGYRYRQSFSFSSGSTSYEKIKKVSIGIGHNEEIDIEDISEKDFLEARKKSEKIISKIRNVYTTKKHTFEIDIFENLNLIIMEIEGVEMADKINFPEKIKDSIVMEITGLKEFSNFNLAEKTK